MSDKGFFLAEKKSRHTRQRFVGSTASTCMVRIGVVVVCAEGWRWVSVLL
jgi:hypothetical protein